VVHGAVNAAGRATPALMAWKSLKLWQVHLRAANKVKFTGLTQNLQVDPAV
jgi:hypothetical protein